MGDCLLWATFSAEKRNVVILTKNVLGYILGDFSQTLFWPPCVRATGQTLKYVGKI
jgi:hypothetical protein